MEELDGSRQPLMSPESCASLTGQELDPNTRPSQRQLVEDLTPRDLDILTAHAASCVEQAWRRLHAVADRERAQEARDLVIEALLGVLEGRIRCREPTKFQSFLFSVLRGMAWNLVRRRTRWITAPDVDLNVLENSSAGPFDLAADLQAREQVDDLIRSVCPPAEAEAVSLVIIDELTSEQAAKELHRGAGTVRSQLSHGSAKLRRLLLADAGYRAIFAGPAYGPALAALDSVSDAHKSMPAGKLSGSPQPV
jgi:RNA polymerase sigma factor (sigma-70 family)